MLALRSIYGASFGQRPDNPYPHFLNLAEYKAAFLEVCNHFGGDVQAGGCGNDNRINRPCGRAVPSCACLPEMGFDHGH